MCSRRVDSAATEILHICSKYIEETASRLEEQEGEEKSERRERSVLVKLLERCRDNRAVPTVMAVDAMFAGVDTTGVSATFLLYQLAANPEKQEILYQEILEAVGTGRVTEDGLRRMKYLRASSQESHRLLPVASGLARKTEQDLVLSGHLVPAGTPVSHWAFVRTSQASQFSQPDRFLPERWLRSDQTRPDQTRPDQTNNNNEMKIITERTSNTALPTRSVTCPSATGPGVVLVGGLPSWRSRYSSSRYSRGSGWSTRVHQSASSYPSPTNLTA